SVLRAGPGHDGHTQEEAPMKQIAGYEILGALGRGGFGETYKARQPGTGRLVLIESAPLPRDAGPEERERFRVRTLERARLRHPNVVQLLDVVEDSERVYLVEEFVEGQPLTRKLDEGPTPPAQAAQLVAALAHAVQAVHQHGILHRDLKPGNVLLAADGTPRLTGFGPPPSLEDVTGSASLYGT